MTAHEERVLPASHGRSGNSLPLTGADEYEAETFFPMLGMPIRVVNPRAADRHVPLGDRGGFLVLSGERS